MKKPPCSTCRMITVIFSGVQIFRIFAVPVKREVSSAASSGTLSLLYADTGNLGSSSFRSVTVIESWKSKNLNVERPKSISKD